MFLTLNPLTTEFTAHDPNLWRMSNGYTGRLPGVTHPQQIVYHNDMVHLTVAPALQQEYYLTPLLFSAVPLLYGRIEFKAKLANTKAVQAAWLYRWEPTQQKEIDIFEIAPAADGYANAVQTNYHLITTDPQGTIIHHQMEPVLASDVRYNPLDWHTYRLDWTPTEIHWYVDDYLIRTLRNHPFHEPLTLKFSIEIHKNWLGIPEPEELPATMHIDWLRVWNYTDPFAY